MGGARQQTGKHMAQREKQSHVLTTNSREDTANENTLITCAHKAKQEEKTCYNIHK